MGILIQKTGPSEFSLTQPGLIEKVLKVTGISDANGTHTPTTGAPVGADLDGVDFKEDWEYASVVGMLRYLAANTRADMHMQHTKLQVSPTDLSILMPLQSCAY